MDWLGEEAQRAVRAYLGPRLISKDLPKTTFIKQLSYLERKLGKKGAAGAAGVSVRTWNDWRAGRRRPTGASIAKVRHAYEQRRRPEVEKLHRTLARKRLADTSVQITGTIRISDYQAYRYNFAEQELRHLNLTDALGILDDPDALADFFTEVIHLATGVDVTWPLNDVIISLS